MKKIVIGILAHVDAGKTTLSEALLYTCGAIRKMGRVDHKNAFLETYSLERSRGITIFSKQAELQMGDFQVTLLDTPGHVDFSAEMERTLQVLDYAILVISGADGIQGHTRTLWALLEKYQIPVFLFVNKMDQSGADHAALMNEIKKRLDGNCIDFTADRQEEEWQEQLAMCEDEMLDRYLEEGEIDLGQVPRLIRERKVYPCYFGSALKMTGVDQFIRGLEENFQENVYPKAFGAKVYKISRDAQNTRLTHIKITGGSLKVKETISGIDDHGEPWEEKADQIRIYSGEKYEMVNEAVAGTVCAVTGLSLTRPGQGLGAEEVSPGPLLEPVLTYQIRFPEETDMHKMLIYLRTLEEEDPLLRVVWKEQLEEIHVQVMGQIQMEILKNIMEERFRVHVVFDAGNIVYKETIQEPVEGIGHFEPLRHYAEVHLLLEPGEAGSGMVYAADCSEDLLDRNWQRLILTHLMEREHRGVLTGSPITDMKITLKSGRAHLKHTEGGDFRQATYRAVRQGLRKSKSVLLEPYYDFRLELPAAMVGRGMADIQKRCGDVRPPVTEGDTAVLTGLAPVSTMRDYQTEVLSYTRGTGKLFCTLKGYYPCHDQQEVVSAYMYDPEADLENPTGSVFCAHGAGFPVPWNQVEEYMHLESIFKKQDTIKTPVKVERENSWKGQQAAYEKMEKELEEIFERTYGPIGNRKNEGDSSYRSAPGWKKKRKDAMGFQGSSGPEKRNYGKKKDPEKEYILVDGYNIIFAWEDLKELAQENLDSARDKLIDIMCNYQGYKQATLILVFDAYKVKGNQGSVEKHHNIYVVYTKEAETADQYIEKTVHEIGRSYRVTVATSDRLEQVIILGQGGSRMSARELLEDVILVSRQIREQTEMQGLKNRKNYLFDSIDEETASALEKVRLGQEEGKTEK